jgi:hypothetical protein
LLEEFFHKGVREVVFRIHRRPKFAATGTLNAEVTITVLGDRTVTTKPHNRKLPWKVARESHKVAPLRSYRTADFEEVVKLSEADAALPH